MARERTAALIVIGNEILSGKVVDTNSPFLAEQLRGLGVSLRRIVVIPDEVDVIADTVRSIHPEFEVVFTSGGVGPTHDDVTISGIAAGLGRQVVCHPVLESKLREYFGEAVNPARLKMAEVVEGTELLFEGNVSFPTMRVENIYVLPGIPEIFREKFTSMRQRFATDPFHLRAIYTNAPESTIAVFLNRTMESFPELMLGSYPKLNDPEYRVRITLESKSQDYVEQAFMALLEMLPPSAVVRTE
ncbi:MAG TPA: competence/damage-inducible protein A [Candidatus Binatia bacterium]|nr:competence/damage-inducible protein A [Candidatus Binatia bacterium]